MSNKSRLQPASDAEVRQALGLGRKLILPGRVKGGKELVRNVPTGRVLPCCWSDCDQDGDNRYRIQVPHDQPRWPGEKLVYIYCGHTHLMMAAEALRSQVRG